MGHSLDDEWFEAVSLHNMQQLEKLTGLKWAKPNHQQWLATLDSHKDDISGHLLRAGSDDVSPKERAESNRILRQHYKDAITRGEPIDPMLRDWATRNMHAVLCSENDPVEEFQLLMGLPFTPNGGKTRGRPISDQAPDLRIADRIVHAKLNSGSNPQKPLKTHATKRLQMVGRSQSNRYGRFTGNTAPRRSGDSIAG
jgi:hypothetical protein